MRKIILIFTVLLINFAFINPCYAIKIGLQTDAETIGIGATTSASLIDANTNKTVTTLEAMKGYELRPYHNQIAIKLKGKFYKINSDNIVLKSPGGFISAKNKWYRGVFYIQNKNGKLTVINNVDLEDYLKGVVPAEMPSAWELEAQKAQAIAARSFAMANLGKRAKYGYDLGDTTSDQVYAGASAETARTNKAVDDTRGLVLTYDYKIISAFYYASAGGQTANASEAWGTNLPYIRSVPSFDDNVKRNGHGVGMSQHGANNLAKQGYNAYQILQYFYKDVKFARVNQDAYN